MNDLEFITNCLNKLINSDGSIINDEMISRVNNIAICLYNENKLNHEQIETLKQLLMICNIFYNRTDNNYQLINDGLYDILLQKYKEYDSNFQVGSIIVNLNNINLENIIDSTSKNIECPIIFHDEIKRNEIHQEIFDNIMCKNSQNSNADDFTINPINWLDYDMSKRLHDTEHNHPDLVGTLDKAKFVLNQDAIEAGVFDDPNIVILERDFFQDHINKGILDPNRVFSVIVELKYDGISVEADCGKEVISARTRGDTNNGVAADLTSLLRGYQFKHAQCMNGESPIGVKFEAIMTKSNLSEFNRLRGKSYSNCRTAIIGLFGALDGYLYKDLITLVPLAIDRKDVPEIYNRLEEVEFLNRTFISHGEPLRYCIFAGNLTEILYYIKAFWDEAKIARDYLNFMYDGIVVSYLEEDLRQKLGRKNYINKYSIAVKFDPEEKQTIFRGYTFEVGQNGQITPMIHYDPVEFIGTIHTKSTGSSYERFKSLGLKYGDFINVTYRNDVMPYVSNIDCDANRNNKNPVIPFINHCPVCGSKLVLSDSGKTMSCSNLDCKARSQARMTNMMQKLNIKGFADATFESLSNLNHLYLLYLNNNIDYYIDKLGTVDGTNFYNIINELRIKPIKDYILIGALGFTSIAQKKWKSILEQITINEINMLYKKSLNKNDFELKLIERVPNIGIITGQTIANEYEYFKDDIDLICTWNNIENSFGKSNSSKLQIRFSGCRNLQLTELLNNNGYDIDNEGSVTKNTNILLVPYPGFSSNKVIKAQSYGATIVVINDFINNMEKYIGEKLI